MKARVLAEIDDAAVWQIPTPDGPALVYSKTTVNKVIISMTAYPRLKTRVQAENDEVMKRKIIQ